MTTSTSRDPVTSYARRIVSAKLPAGRLVRLACERHLRDLERQSRSDFPFHFVPRRAAKCFAFFREFLTLDDARPFELMRWFQFILGSLEGWVDANGHRRFQTSYVETSKGTGKTPVAAAYGLYALAVKGERVAEIYSLGVDAAQANYLYKFAKRMAERSDELRAVLDVGEHNIAYLVRDSFFRPLSAEGRSLDNKRPYLAIVDELHEHPTEHLDDSEAPKMEGFTSTVIAQPEFKAELWGPLSDEARQRLESVVGQYYMMFKRAVARNRGISADEVEKRYGEVGPGRLLTAREALKVGMVDRIATLDQTIARLAAGRRSSAVRASLSHDEPPCAAEEPQLSDTAKAAVRDAVGEYLDGLAVTQPSESRKEATEAPASQGESVAGDALERDREWLEVV
jgi:hypothetical protein